MKIATRISELAESATLAVTAKAARMKAAGEDVIGFGAGEPDFDTPPHICRAGTNAIETGNTRYPKPASGLPATREAVCKKFARDNRLDYKPDQVIVTAGGKMACYLAIQSVVNPGDEVIIPKPYWVSYPEMVKLAGGIPVLAAGPETNDYKLTQKDLADTLTDQTRLLLLCSPSNPSGVVYTPSELRALADVLADRDTLVLSDEIYDQLVYTGHEHLSFAAISNHAREHTLTVNAGSKTYAMTGWRIGYAAGPNEWIRAMAKLQSQTTSGAATFTQVALAEALAGDQAVVETMRAQFEQRGRHMHARLCDMPGVRCAAPGGAFYAFPNVADTCRRLGLSGSLEFSDRLLEAKKVAVVPGIAFGLDEHVRLSFAAGIEVIDKGLDRLRDFVNGA